VAHKGRDILIVIRLWDFLYPGSLKYYVKYFITFINESNILYNNNHKSIKRVKRNMKRQRA
jgi:hypothetical protein